MTSINITDTVLQDEKHNPSELDRIATVMAKIPPLNFNAKEDPEYVEWAKKRREELRQAFIAVENSTRRYG